MHSRARLCGCVAVVLLLAHATAQAGAAPSRAEEAPPVSARPVLELPWPALVLGLSASEHVVARRLIDRLARHDSLDAADAETASTLAARHSDHTLLQSLAGAVSVAVAYGAASARDCDAAGEHLRKAHELEPEATYVAQASVDVLLLCDAWPEAEAAARDLLARQPENAEATLGLAYALLRQDRDQEAADALDSAPSLRSNERARALRERLAKHLAVEAGFREQRLSHFNLRYDGERHEAIGEYVLQALERHFTTLATTFAYEPQAPVPVVLLTREAYFDATGAPAWSGGEFSGYDGRVRVPVLGLTPAKVNELAGTLMHELTHAFVYEISRGAASWELQEGLAQYMEGKRTAAPSTGDKASIAAGRSDDVRGKYLAALSFVEYLMSQGDQPSVNLLLDRLGKSGDVDAAWKDVYGRGLSELKAAWQETIQAGSP